MRTDLLAGDRLVRASGAQSLQDKPGGVYLRRADLMPDADRILLHAVARVVIVTERGTLEEQLVQREIEPELPPALVPSAPARSCAHRSGTAATTDLGAR